MNLSSLFDKKLLCALLQVYLTSFLRFILEILIVPSRKIIARVYLKPRSMKSRFLYLRLYGENVCPFFHGEALLTFHP